jgi:hypothetical protein
MLISILIALAAIVVVLVMIISSRPNNFRTARSITMSAPAPAVFALVNDFHKWEGWNPWGKIDPNAKLTYQGSPAGVGASYSWAGNNKVGAGTGTIIESQPSELIRIKLEFLRPMKATNLAEFTFKSQGNQTLVTWSMSGKNNFMFKAVGLFINCDDMVGKEFEKGLAQMKSLAETSPASAVLQNV